MKLACFVIPYFGHLPETFSLWAESCRHNPRFDFIFITDCDFPPPYIQNENNRASVSLPDNIKVIQTTFEALRERVQQLFNFPIILNRPYKLCDYKPAYGEIFQTELAGYEWFGWCDIDLVWGDLYKYLGVYLEDPHNEKLLEHGHCTLLRNNAKMRSLYREHADGIMGYEEVFSTHRSMYFDEHGPAFSDNAFNGLCKKKGIKEIKMQSGMIPILDCSCFTPWFAPFCVNKGERIYRNTLLVYEAGKVYWGYRRKGSSKMYIDEVMYAHLQKRRIRIKTFATDQFCISPPATVIGYDSEWRSHIRHLAPCSPRMVYWDFRISIKILLRRFFMRVLRIKNNIIGRK